MFFKVKSFFRLNRMKMINQGQELQEIVRLYSLNISFERNEKNLPEYKNYEDLLLIILKTHKKFGLSLKRLLSPLRENLNTDIRWELKIFSEFRSGLIQFFLISGITWSFAGFTTRVLNTEMNTKLIILVGSIQLAGAYLFGFFIKFFERKIFSELLCINQKTLRFEVLLNSHLSSQEIIDKSGVGCFIEQSLIIDKNSINGLLTRALKKWKNFGDDISSELIEIREELIFKFNQNYDHFLMTVKTIKFLILILFYLAPYFLLIAGLIKSFLIE